MKRLLFLWLVCLSTTAVFAQSTEICDDGIDNDGDGFIDCYDPDCSSFGKCDGTFLGNDATCEVKPGKFPDFSMKLDYASEAGVTNNAARLAIGDLDRDGMPEIVTMNRYSDTSFPNTITILSGTNPSNTSRAKTKYQKSFSWSPQWEVALANIDNDACGEIFIWGDGGGVGKRIYKLDCQLNEIGRTDFDFESDPINFGLADFNGDGKVEIYVKDQIYDAHTMKRLVDGGNWKNVAGAPVAVDIDGHDPENFFTGGDTNLELVIGLKIFKVNLTAGLLTEIHPAPAPQYFIRDSYNSSSVADLDKDGYLDIVASGSTVKKGQNTTIFLYNVKKGTVKTFSDMSSFTSDSKYVPNGWNRGTGRINIGDLDGDGNLDLAYVTGKYLMALDDQLNLKWHQVVNEETSGYTGCTLFDFNGDGKSEIVYRDERKLYIIDGKTGAIDPKNTVACVSRTSSEYPFVADVDADGSTEICVPCIVGDPVIWKADGSNIDDFSSDDKWLKMSSEIRVYKSANDAEPWVPARRVWNQHAYFNVNINDDLTIPRIQQKHHLVFSTGSCTTGANRPLNSFLNQSPYLNSKGCPTYASPDLAHVANSMTIVAPTCPATSFQVSFKITNLGDISLTGKVPISFYNGDPTKVGATKLSTHIVDLVKFNTSEVLAVNNLTVNGPGAPFTLYVVLNDAGTAIATPISLPNTSFIECNYDNIISVPVNPKPVKITGELIADNLKCTGSTTPDNGGVRAFVQTGAVKNTTDYNFFWFKGTKAAIDATPDHIQPTYTGLPAGVYTVFAVHKTASCSSDTVSVTVGEVEKTVKVVVDLVKGVTDCKNPNGELKAVVNNGVDPVSNFQYEWFESLTVGSGTQVGVSNIATNLKPLTSYAVRVTDKITGCQSAATLLVPSDVVIPVVSATPTPILCSSTNSGSVTANVGGATSGYKFDWYNGPSVKPSADHTASTYSNRPAGDYTVVATNTITNCVSTKVTVTVTQTTAPVVTASTTAQQTSCDPARPNGAVTASATGGSGNFTTEWFKGQNTLAANKITSTTGLNVGIYTVRMKDNVSGCSATAETTVTLQTPASPPSITPTPTPLSQCVPFNGSITTSVSVGNVADYTFSWYKGNAVKVTPDFTDTDNVLSGLGAGVYTVKAIHTTTFCQAQAKTVTVLDITPTISIVWDVVASTLPSDCNSSNGEMKVTVSAPGNTLGFQLEWFTGNSATIVVPFTPPTGGDIYYTASNLRVGKYTISATDLNTGCKSTKVFDLPFASSPELKLVSQNDILDCKPASRGDITVDLFFDPVKNTAGFTSSDFDFFIYQNPNDPGNDNSEITPAVNGPALPYTTPTTLFANTYTVVAVVNSPDPGKTSYNGCRTNPIRAEILKNTTNPEIEFVSQTPNTNCTLPGNGTITVTTVNSPAITASFDWYNGATVSGASIHTGATLTRNSGTYTVEVINTVTECKAEASYAIYDNPDMIAITSGLNITDITSCDTNGDLSTTGRAEVTTINENAATVTPVGYTFDWTALATGTVINGVNPLTGQAKGFYLLKATKANGCFTEKEFEIKDKTTGSPYVSLDAFGKPELCIDPKDGFLKVVATALIGSPTFSYEWYNGATASGTVIGTSDRLAIPRPASPSPGAPAPADGMFTIKAINTANNCFITDTYRMPVTVNEVLISASSSSPITNCVRDNGVVFATVTNDTWTQYAYNWSTGDNTNQVSNLGVGSYTVTATDLLDAYCVSSPKTVLLEDMRVTPIVVAAMSDPLTNCDVVKANGVATAAVGDNILNYTFDWFAGLTATGTSFASGAEIGGLLDQVYTVRATDNITECAGTTQVTIIRNTLNIPNPQIVILSHVTSCLDDNGAMTASVGGNVNDYVFDWSLGNTPKAVADYTDQFTIDSLSIGLYTVIATSRITGCVSGPDTDQIIEQKLLPEFDFEITPASCEAANGSASMFITNGAIASEVEWNINGEIFNGFNLDQIKAGTYNVLVTTNLGCQLEKTIIVTTDIRPFNGVSRNGDGKNDIFYINCIDNFPGNNVKIFNRAGTKVYEDDNYDNIDIYFDGKSNKGVSPMGINLPDGTYYYIIDKKNGSKPLAGYLELVN